MSVNERMDKFILLLVLVCGFLAGYLIGDYRGGSARETLKEVENTGKVLDTEREATIAKLNQELEGINSKHRHELDALRKHSTAKSAAWRNAKDELEDQIKLGRTRLAELEYKLQSIISKRANAPSAELPRMDAEIEDLLKQREALQTEIKSNSCLQTQVPDTVVNALTEANTAGKKP